jgi:hypothetical protein
MKEPTMPRGIAKKEPTKWALVTDPPKPKPVDVRVVISTLRTLADDLERLENRIGELLGR